MTDTPVTKPHYQVEDEPPDDADTKIALFEQSAETVKGSAEAAQALFINAEAVLGEAFNAAEQAKDTELAERVSDVWVQVQDLITTVHRHGAVLHGSKEIIVALKQQRDAIMGELNGIKDAVKNHDTTHALLSDFVTSLEEEWNEELMWADDYEYADATYNNIQFTLMKVVGLTLTESAMVVDLLCDEDDERKLTNEQIDLLKRLAATLDDTDEDEDGESDD